MLLPKVLNFLFENTSFHPGLFKAVEHSLLQLLLAFQLIGFFLFLLLFDLIQIGDALGTIWSILVLFRNSPFSAIF